MLHQVIEADQLSYNRQAKAISIDQLIANHTKLVKRIAWHVHGSVSSAIEPSDLFQIGMVALVESAWAFEDRGVAFSAYASIRIRGAMVDHLRRGSAMSRTSMQNRRKLQRVRAKVEAQLCRQATDNELAEELGLDLAAYNSLVSNSVSITQESIDEVYSDHQMWFADHGDDAHTLLENSDMSNILNKCISKLPQREAIILQLYFIEELNLEEISSILNITPARVCQIKKKTLNKLNSMMNEMIL